MSQQQHAQPADTDCAIRMRAVRFRWPGAHSDTLAIDDFAMPHGERVFVSGPSGSGKSTLLALAAGIITPTQGQIWVNGTKLSDLGSVARDRFRGDHIGFIFQQFNLVPYLSVTENVLIPCRLSAVRFERAVSGGKTLESVAAELLDRLDLSRELRDRPVSRLSIGQQQRVAAARALIGAPELLIADEPTSALDADRRCSFLNLLLEACRSRGTTLIFVSHDESLAALFPRIIPLARINRAAEPAS